VAVAALVLGTPLLGRAETGTISVRVPDPPAVAFEQTALGRATHPLQITFENKGTTPLAMTPLALRFHATRDGISYECDEPGAGEDRWPATLAPGASFSVDRVVTCDTPLPGRYNLEVRGRPRRGADAEERTYANLSFQIERGANPPLRLPWDTSLHAAAQATTTMRANEEARVMVAMINGTQDSVALSPVRAKVQVSKHGTQAALCPAQDADLAFTGTLAPGRSQSLAIPIDCNFSSDGAYDVAVSVANPSGAKVKLATLTIRVGVVLPPGFRPGYNRGRGPPQSRR
jgi:hypothetical protein